MPLPAGHPPFSSFSSFHGVRAAKPLFCWSECRFVIFAIFFKNPLFLAGQKHGLPKAPFSGPRHNNEMTTSAESCNDCGDRHCSQIAKPRVRKPRLFIYCHPDPPPPPKIGRSRMSERTTSGSSRPSLGVRILAVFSFIS